MENEAIKKKKTNPVISLTKDRSVAILHPFVVIGGKYWIIESDGGVRRIETNLVLNGGAWQTIQTATVKRYLEDDGRKM